jgi:hypothetical protein
MKGVATPRKALTFPDPWRGGERVYLRGYREPSQWIFRVSTNYQQSYHPLNSMASVDTPSTGLSGPTNPFGDLIEQKIAIVPSFTLESGATLTDTPVAYKTWGKLNAGADNVLVICHALTGSADVEDWWVEAGAMSRDAPACAEADIIGGDRCLDLIELSILLGSSSSAAMSLGRPTGQYQV